jgi:16S rRNA (guanine966-N2)-methyltransferase
MSATWSRSLSAPVKRASTPSSLHKVRIIAGRWRGRRIAFPALPDLRPTPDRVRETVFNWLQEIIEGSRCLDLFAGSGALGFEAASRGAASVVMVDQQPRVVEYLRREAEKLGATQVEVISADALSYLAISPPPFDVVFIDPPFRSDRLTESLEAMGSRRVVKASARVYIETEARAQTPPLPEGWRWLRNKRAGNVGYHLAATG